LRRRRLGPAQLGVLASLAVAHPLVYRRPRVAILGSGDEIVDVDQPDAILSGARSPAAILIRWWRWSVRPAGAGESRDRARHAGEPAGALAARARLRSPGDDAGISVGEHDFVRTVLDELGAEQRFWKLRMRPGAPVGFGSCARSLDRPAGNPVSTMVTFELFVRPRSGSCAVIGCRSGDRDRPAAEPITLKPSCNTSCVRSPRKRPPASRRG